MLSDRRTRPYRDECNIPAVIEMGPFAEREECTVENLTEGGAKLRFRRGQAARHFKLLFPVLDDLWDERTVELRWRVGETAGVKFVPDLASEW